MKVAALLLGSVALLAGQGHEGDFVIRFEPAVVLQAQSGIPFQIRVLDDRHKPVINAKVTLQIETEQHTKVRVFDAASTEPGVYVAKPIFPSAGEWSVYVEVRRTGLMSARTIDFNVPDAVSP
ncbi:MAG: FixH family protein [Acidobacteriota bacterium]|nr:FixH family protein [Acidobacteriota bacterium]